jgi:hypothetical protein
MIKYTFEIKKLGTTDQYVNCPNYVAQILIDMTAIDDETGIYGYSQSMIALPPRDESSSFIPYADLTSDIVASWVDPTNIGMTQAQELAAQHIEMKKNLGSVLPPLTDHILDAPWVTPPSSDTVVAETSSSNTVPSLASAIYSEEKMTALILRVLDEIEASKV